MISVDEALAQLRDHGSPLGVETVSLSQCAGRVVAEDIIARLTQPPFNASAMDGYAVRFADVADVGNALEVIGEAPAGAPFAGAIGAGEAVRIFTGGVVPDGADHVIIQEDVRREGGQITVTDTQSGARHIRRAGIDFKTGQTLVGAGTCLGDIDASVLAAANIATVSVYKKPRVVLFSNGDELREPGETLAPGQIINSNHYGLANLIRSWGAVPDYVGCIADDKTAVQAAFDDARESDIIVPIGGASVGDYDYVRTAFAAAGGEIIFSKIAVKPGKPTWFGRLGGGPDAPHVLGLPGNPTSALVCAIIFLRALIAAKTGAPDGLGLAPASARLTTALPVQGSREGFLRGEANFGADGGLHVTPILNQDSSLLRPFLRANALIRRPVGVPAINAGDCVPISLFGFADAVNLT